jgi:hypothetical protein
MDCVEHWLAPARRASMVARGLRAASIVGILAFQSACTFFRAVIIVVGCCARNPRGWAVFIAQLQTDWSEVFEVDAPRGFRAASAAAQVRRSEQGYRGCIARHKATTFTFDVFVAGRARRE